MECEIQCKRSQYGSRIPESACFTPPLTTIQQERQEIGRTAVRQIVCLIQAGHEFGDGRETVRIQPQPLVHESSAPSRVKKEVHHPAE